MLVLMYVAWKTAIYFQPTCVPARMIIGSDLLHIAQIVTDRIIFDDLAQFDVQIFAQLRKVADRRSIFAYELFTFNFFFIKVKNNINK